MEHRYFTYCLGLDSLDAEPEMGVAVTVTYWEETQKEGRERSRMGQGRTERGRSRREFHGDYRVGLSLRQGAKFPDHPLSPSGSWFRFSRGQLSRERAAGKSCPGLVKGHWEAHQNSQYTPHGPLSTASGGCDSSHWTGSWLGCGRAGIWKRPAEIPGHFFSSLYSSQVT